MSTVFVVDDDPAILKAIARLLAAAGREVQTYASPREFLERHDRSAPGCLLLDLAMPGSSGLELQQALAAEGAERAVVFISGRGDIPTSVEAMKAGAVDFLTKPIDAERLLAAVDAAIEKDASARRARDERRRIEERLATLTLRERQVLEHVVAGQLNKHIAADLGTVEKTVKVHRGRLMHKMGAASLIELVRMADLAGIRPPAAPPAR
jgi:FixJ family two-component response regulator